MTDPLVEEARVKANLRRWSKEQMVEATAELITERNRLADRVEELEALGRAVTKQVHGEPWGTEFDGAGPANVSGTIHSHTKGGTAALIALRQALSTQPTESICEACKGTGRVWGDAYDGLTGDPPMPAGWETCLACQGRGTTHPTESETKEEQ